MRAALLRKLRKHVALLEGCNQSLDDRGTLGRAQGAALCGQEEKEGGVLARCARITKAFIIVSAEDGCHRERAPHGRLYDYSDELIDDRGTN